MATRTSDQHVLNCEEERVRSPPRSKGYGRDVWLRFALQCRAALQARSTQVPSADAVQGLPNALEPLVGLCRCRGARETALLDDFDPVVAPATSSRPSTGLRGAASGGLSQP